MSSRRRAHSCPVCRGFVPSAASYCPQCGSEARAARDGWFAASAVFGFAVISLTMVAAWSMAWPDSDGAAAPGPNASAPEGTTTWEGLDGRAVADNLFNHVVDAAAAGDSVQLRTFLPLALAAYRDVEPLDPDGLFHLATLQRIGEMPDDAVQSALEILSIDEQHLLGLGTAAVASREAGQSGEARAFYARYTESYDAEIERALPEYIGHSAFLGRVVSEARELLGPR